LAILNLEELNLHPRSCSQYSFFVLKGGINLSTNHNKMQSETVDFAPVRHETALFGRIHHLVVRKWEVSRMLLLGFTYEKHSKARPTQNRVVIVFFVRNGDVNLLTK